MDRRRHAARRGRRSGRRSRWCASATPIRCSLPRPIPAWIMTPAGRRPAWLLLVTSTRQRGVAPRGGRRSHVGHRRAALLSRSTIPSPRRHPPRCCQLSDHALYPGAARVVDRRRRARRAGDRAAAHASRWPGRCRSAGCSAHRRRMWRWTGRGRRRPGSRCSRRTPSGHRRCRGWTAGGCSGFPMATWSTSISRCPRGRVSAAGGSACCTRRSSAWWRRRRARRTSTCGPMPARSPTPGPSSPRGGGAVGLACRTTCARCCRIRPSCSWCSPAFSRTPRPASSPVAPTRSASRRPSPASSGCRRHRRTGAHRGVRPRLSGQLQTLLVGTQRRGPPVTRTDRDRLQPWRCRVLPRWNSAGSDSRRSCRCSIRCGPEAACSAPAASGTGSHRVRWARRSHAMDREAAAGPR